VQQILSKIKNSIPCRLCCFLPFINSFSICSGKLCSILGRLNAREIRSIEHRSQNGESEMLKGSWISLAMCLTLGSHGQTVAPIPPTGTVWVPALVESKSGKIAYGLSVDDFSIKDDGVEQQIVLQSDLGAQPISLLL
jgi:hypothetical protein